MNDLAARLQTARTAGAGWGYRAGEPSRVEPTLWALLGLWAHDVPLPADALAWLTAAQRADGSWGGTDAPDASWVTGPAVFTLARLGLAPAARRRGTAWLLGTRSEPLPAAAEPAGLAVDGALPGWPWTAGCFGWVEPTAHALLALRAAAVRTPRVDAAARFLLDRRCAGGGWNYGAVRVLDTPLPPFPQTTAVAAVALAAVAAPGGLDRDLGVLAGFLAEPLGVFDLAWAAIALDACGRDPAAALGRLAHALDGLDVWQEHVHAVALATVAAALPRGTNPFRVPA
jgi:hypothetical protein